jgi:hypothetical protein
MHNDNKSQHVAKYREDRRPYIGYWREEKGKLKVLRSKRARKTMHVVPFKITLPFYNSKWIVKLSNNLATYPRYDILKRHIQVQS